MIGYIKGNIIGKRDDAVIVDTGGIGYIVFVPSSYMDHTGMVEYHVETIIRETSFSLFGFLSEEERKNFLLFTSVQGVGPKMALTLLSVNNISNLIANSKTSELMKINGVGKRLAERLIQELGEKVSVEQSVKEPRKDMHILACKQALKGLGYGMKEINNVLLTIEEKGGIYDLNESELLQQALKLF